MLDLTAENAIADLELPTPLSEKDAADDKLWIVDIKARDQTGRLFDVEMQMVNQSFFLQSHRLLDVLKLIVDGS